MTSRKAFNLVFKVDQFKVNKVVAVGAVPGDIMQDWWSSCAQALSGIFNHPHYGRPVTEKNSDLTFKTSMIQDSIPSPLKPLWR